jgi:hypothetical protein
MPSKLEEKETAFMELAKMLTEEHLMKIDESIRGSKKNFALRKFVLKNKKKQKQPKDV